MASQNHSNSRISEIYQELRSVPWQSWTEQHQEKFYNRYLKDSASNKSEIASCTVFLARVAQESTEEQFAKCLETGETPPMKLQAEEMNLVRGGGIWDRIVTYLWGKTLGNI